MKTKEEVKILKEEMDAWVKKFEKRFTNLVDTIELLSDNIKILTQLQQNNKRNIINILKSINSINNKMYIFEQINMMNMKHQKSVNGSLKMLYVMNKLKNDKTISKI